MVALSMDGTPGGNGGSISGSMGEPGAGGFGGAGTPLRAARWRRCRTASGAQPRRRPR